MFAVPICFSQILLLELLTWSWFRSRFMGVFHRPRNEVHIFEKGEKHGTVAAGTQVIPWGDPCLKNIIPDDLFKQLQVSGLL